MKGFSSSLFCNVSEGIDTSSSMCHGGFQSWFLTLNNGITTGCSCFPGMHQFPCSWGDLLGKKSVQNQKLILYPKTTSHQVLKYELTMAGFVVQSKNGPYPKKLHKNVYWSHIGSGAQMAPVILEIWLSMGEILAPPFPFLQPCVLWSTNGVTSTLLGGWKGQMRKSLKHLVYL